MPSVCCVGRSTTKLFVGNLRAACKRRDLLSVFEAFGAVKECDIIKNFAFVASRARGAARTPRRGVKKPIWLTAAPKQDIYTHSQQMIRMQPASLWRHIYNLKSKRYSSAIIEGSRVVDVCHFHPMSASERYAYRFEINNYINNYYKYNIVVSRELWPTRTGRFVEFSRLITYEHMAYALWFWYH